MAKPTARVKKPGKKAGPTIKQENFCIIYVETGNASEAYRQAYAVGEGTKDKTVWDSASKLLKDPIVAQRVMELREEHRLRHNVTVDSLTVEYEEARELAKGEKQAASMVSATTGKAKLHGLATEKHEHTGKGGEPLKSSPTVVLVTAETVKAEIMEIFQKHGASGSSSKQS